MIIEIKFFLKRFLLKKLYPKEWEIKLMSQKLLLQKPLVIDFFRFKYFSIKVKITIIFIYKI